MPEGDWSTSGRVNSRKVALEADCSPWDKHSTLAKDCNMYMDSY